MGTMAGRGGCRRPRVAAGGARAGDDISAEATSPASHGSSLHRRQQQREQRQRQRQRPRRFLASSALCCLLLGPLLLLSLPERAPAFAFPPPRLAFPPPTTITTAARCWAMRAGGSGGSGGDTGSSTGGWMAPFSQALQGLRPSAATGPLTARRGGGAGGNASSSPGVLSKKGGATLRPRRQAAEERQRLHMAEEEELEEVEEAAAGGVNKGLLAAGILLPTLLAVGVALYQSGAYESVQGVNIAEVFREVESKVTELGPWGYALFAGIYILAEVLAVPAVPLTASSGYLFGLVNGTGIVVLSATIAASVSFLIGRTLLRSTVERWMDKYPKFQRLDRAIKEEGFKIILLLRLSPIFPFALSNYMYGLTAVDFWPYFWATLFGFLPGTIAYVYSGYVGRSLTEGGGGLGGLPWYGYAAAAVGLGLLGKIVSDAANRAIGEYDPDEDDGSGI